MEADMMSKATGIKGLLAPIWQEVSSLWAGAEFAFLDLSSDADAQEAPSAAFYDMTSMREHSAMEAGHCC
jgi:hypothetical protein